MSSSHVHFDGYYAQPSTKVTNVIVYRKQFPVVFLLGDQRKSPDQMLMVAAIVHQVFLQTPKGMIEITMMQPLRIESLRSLSGKAQFAKAQPAKTQRAYQRTHQEEASPKTAPKKEQPRQKRASAEEEPSQRKSSKTEQPRTEAEPPKTQTASHSAEAYQYLSEVLSKKEGTPVVVNAESSPYELLGISDTKVKPTEAEITKAFRSLLLKLHPDKAENDADRAQREAAFKVFNEAYQQAMKVL